MIKAFLNAVVSLFDFFWQVVLFLWVGLNATGTWLHNVVHPVLRANGWISQMVLFVGSLLFSPLPWWTAFFFLLIPMSIAIPLLVIFFIMFIFSFARGVSF